MTSKLSRVRRGHVTIFVCGQGLSRHPFADQSHGVTGFFQKSGFRTTSARERAEIEACERDLRLVSKVSNITTALLSEILQRVGRPRSAATDLHDALAVASAALPHREPRQEGRAGAVAGARALSGGLSMRTRRISDWPI